MAEVRTAAPFPDFTRANGLVYTSGVIAMDPATPPTPQGLRPISDDFELQARCCLERLAQVLTSADSGLANVLRLECFLVRASDLGTWHRLFVETFPAPRPARTTLVASPPIPGFLIEIQAIASQRDLLEQAT